MNEEYFDWDDCLKKGNRAEELVKKEFEKFMKPISDHFLNNKVYYYGLTPKETNKQVNGIDGKYKFTFQYDIKVNSYFSEPYRKILLENRHEGINIYYNEQETMQNGWFWYSKSDVIFFLWWAKDHTHFFSDGYYLFLNNLRNWFNPNNYEEHKNKYPTDRNGNKWWTWNYLIPITDIPDNCILRMNKTIFKTDIEESYFYKWFDLPKKIQLPKNNKFKTDWGKWIK